MPQSRFSSIAPTHGEIIPEFLPVLRPDRIPCGHIPPVVLTESENLNFKKFLIVVAVAVVAIVTYKLLTRIDYSNPVTVATGFTKAMKSHNTGRASAYVVPSQAAEWRQSIDEKLDGMKSGATENYFDHIPADPGFAAPVTIAGKSVAVSADKSFSLPMTQVDGKWYVESMPF